MIPKMKELYEAGWSTTAIGQELNLHRETVRLRLIAAGVELLDCNGRPKTARSVEPVKPKTPLSDEEVEKLRKLVNFVPERDLHIQKRAGWAARKKKES